MFDSGIGIIAHRVMKSGVLYSHRRMNSKRMKNLLMKKPLKQHNAIPIAQVRNKSEFRLERQDTYWRMDRDTFFRFVQYIYTYFKPGDPNYALEYEDILHVEIADSDLKVVSSLFGSYFPNPSTLMLNPVYPGAGVMYWHWAKSFTLYIYEKMADRNILRIIFMKACHH